MKIEAKEVEALQLALEKGLQRGYRYMVIPGGKDNAVLQPEQWPLFKDKLAALHHSYVERSRDGSIVDPVPIQALKLQLERRLEFQQAAASRFAGPQDIKLDIGLIQFQERARGEIFAEDITRQLKAHQILPDVKALKKHIDEDKHTFQIDGIQREQGADKNFTIRVEQNEHRAFMIQAIEKMPQVQEWVKSEGLRVAVYKDDLKNLRDTLQRESENGHRFVAFPAAQVVGKDNFVAFKSTFAALQHAHENRTDRDHYLIRSIHAVQLEIGKILENQRENSNPIKESERGQRNSRGSELSR